MHHTLSIYSDMFVDIYYEKLIKMSYIMSSSFSSLTSTTCDCAQWCCCFCCSHPCPWRLNEPGWKFLYANLWKTLQPTSAELLPLNHQSILLTDVRTNNEQKLVQNWHWKCRCRIHREKMSKKRKKFGHCLLYRNYTDRHIVIQLARMSFVVQILRWPNTNNNDS